MIFFMNYLCTIDSISFIFKYVTEHRCVGGLNKAGTTLGLYTDTHITYNFLHFIFLMSVTAGGPEIPESTCSQVLRSTSNDS